MGDLQPGTVGRRQLCLGRERREEGWRARRPTVSQSCLPPPPRLRSSSRLRQEEPCPRVKSGGSRAGWGALREAGTGLGERAAPCPGEEPSGLCWAKGRRCHCRPLRNSERVCETEPLWHGQLGGDRSQPTRCCQRQAWEEFPGLRGEGLAAGAGLAAPAPGPQALVGGTGGSASPLRADRVQRDGQSDPAPMQLWGPA